MSIETPTATPTYNPLYGDRRFDQPEWQRRNTGAYAPAVHPEGGMVQEIDPNYQERSYSFRDIMESFNPIQHIPIIGQLYRQATGTQLHPVARIIGGAATGPLGVASAFANVALESATGRDVSGHVLQAVAPQASDPRATQMAGGSYVYAPIRDPSAPTAPGANDFTANMAQAPQPDVQGPARTRRPARQQRDLAEQQAAATPPAAAAAAAANPAAAAAAVQPAAGSAMPPAAFGAGGAGVQPPPGVLLAQALGSQAAPGAAGRGIQEYFAHGGVRPLNGEAQRPVQNQIAARSVPNFRPPNVARPVEPAATPAVASDAGAQPAAAPAAAAQNAVGAAAAGERTWFSAAMMHGIDRYRDVRRAQEREGQRVDVSE